MVNESELGSELRKLQQAVRCGEAMEQFPVGTEISDSWTEVKSGRKYDIPLIVVSHREIITAEGQRKLGVILMRGKALPWMRPYNERGCEYKESAIHQYLESEYAAGCSKELLDVAMMNKIEVDLGSIQAKFFLPSATELNRSNGDSSMRIFEYQVWEYFLYHDSNRCYRHMFGYAGTEHFIPADFWLRSCYKPDVDLRMRYMCFINDSGRLGHAEPYYNLGIVPACAVC